MDETANGVREQLVRWFARDIAHTGKSPSEVADAILVRFEVTAKPVVTDAELGRMALESSNWLSLDLSCHAAMEQSFEEVGIQMQERLEAKGLAIVRRGEASK